MASSWFSLLLLLLLLLATHQAHVQAPGKNVHAQPRVRLPRGLLDGLVGAVLSPVLGAGGDDCSSARGDSLNIGATLPLGISAGVSGSSANARSRHGCGASAGANSAGANGGSGSAASAGGDGYGAGGSGTAHGSEPHGGNEVYAQGHHQDSFSSGGKAVPNGSAVNGVGWESQSGSHDVTGSAGQTMPGIASKEPGKGNGFSSSGGFLGGAPVRGEAASVSETSSQSASASMGHGVSVTGDYGQGNLGDAFSGYGVGHVHKSNGGGLSSSKAGSHAQEIPGDSLNQDGSSGVIGGIVSSSSSTSKASSSAGSFAGARPGASHSDSRSGANSSSHSNSFVITT